MSVEELLTRLDSSNTIEIVNEINDLIRKNELVREQGLPDLFYSTMHAIIDSHLSKNRSCAALFTPEFEVLIRCIKNSAATFRSSVNVNEVAICERLVDVCNELIVSDEAYEMLSKKDHSAFKCFQFVLQYFFNLGQGNTSIISHFLSDWSNLSFQLLCRTKDIAYEISTLASMILVNLCIDKHNESELDIHFTKLDTHDFIKLLNRVFTNLDYVSNKADTANNNKCLFIDMDQEELEFLVDESSSNWSFRLVDYLLETEVYLSRVLCEFHTYDLIDRISLLKVFKVKLFKSCQSDQAHAVSSFRVLISSSDFIENFVAMHVKANRFFLDYLVNLTESPEYETQKSNHSILVHMHLAELKHLSYCLSDLLTVIHESKQLAHLAQANNQLLEQTCSLFKALYENNALKELFSIEVDREQDFYKSTHSNLKCELIRLIGILVFESTLNQGIVAENGVMELIAKANLDVDVCNPFVREWSLIALKHILETNDLK